MTDTIDFKLIDANPDLTNEELEKHPDIVKGWKHQLTYIGM
ncbi:hypothetical protein [Pedobacter sp. G11]|nr:hypothetical protein [Pedobacter sp. G11]